MLKACYSHVRETALISADTKRVDLSLTTYVSVYQHRARKYTRT
jgi:hypothetical protein